MRTEVFITSEFITLGQFLKYENLIESGGSVKFFLEEIPVFINNEQDNRRGRKLYPGDIVFIEEFGEFLFLLPSLREAGSGGLLCLPLPPLPGTLVLAAPGTCSIHPPSHLSSATKLLCSHPRWPHSPLPVYFGSLTSANPLTDVEPSRGPPGVTAALAWV